MGVTGLWRLIEPSGKPVPLETLENKVLAIDISIWLHQAVKGFQDSKGGALPNAHLLGIYHRVCKLLYFRIKPVFVFDGAVPALKKQTIAKRNQSRSKTLNEAEKIQKQLIDSLLKYSAINKVISEKAKANLEAAVKPTVVKESNKTKQDELFKLPNADFDTTLSTSEEEDGSESSDFSSMKHWDLHTVDEKSQHFRSLPADVRHEILTELKETRKQSSWDRIHEIPKESGDFSSYQMKRLLKRYSVQVSLDEAAKEMGGHSLSLGELETLLRDQGIVSSNKDIGYRIASDENTRFLLIKDIKKAIEEAKKEEEKKTLEKSDQNFESNEIEVQEKEELKASTSKENDAVEPSTVTKPLHHEDEYDEQMQMAIQLSLQSEACVSEQSSQIPRKTEFSFLENISEYQFSSDSDSELQKEESKKLTSAKNYMIEYSGLTPSEIEKIIGNSTSKTNVDFKLSKQSSRLKEDCKNELKIANILKENEQFKEEKQISVDIKTTNDEHSKEEKEIIEVMSDSDSSESDDFAEVSSSNKQLNKESSSLMEIVINPSAPLEDDLFSDIFSKPSEDKLNDKEFQPQEENKSHTDPGSLKTDSIQSSPIISKESEEIPEINEKIGARENEKEDIIMPDNTDSPRDSSLINTEEQLEKIEQVNSEIKSSPEKNLNTQTQKLTRAENKQKVIEELLQTLKNAQNSRQDDVIPKEDPTPETLDKQHLEEIQENLLQEQQNLLKEKSTKERMATNLTEQMYQEAQELLQLFGVPYIIAPMEAEAQCAFLDSANLTDGTITDDSDIWLFGGKTVYKNFFNQSKHVLEFRAENIQHHFKLTREQMVLLALLVGSDYTMGIQGIGPVTALEILAAFPYPKTAEISLSHQQLLLGLSEFRRWLNGNIALPGKTTLRNKLKNVVFTENFPSYQVIKAYLEPKIDDNKEPFSWAKPDIVGLTDFAKEKFGWSRQKSEEILKPVIKRMEERHIQKSIRDYFKTKYKIHSTEIESKMSKRVQKAVRGIGNEGKSSEDEKDKKKSKPRAKRKKETDIKQKTENDEGDGDEFKELDSSSKKLKIVTDQCKKRTSNVKMKSIQNTKSSSNKSKQAKETTESSLSLNAMQCKDINVVTIPQENDSSSNKNASSSKTQTSGVESNFHVELNSETKQEMNKETEYDSRISESVKNSKHSSKNTRQNQSKNSDIDGINECSSDEELNILKETYTRSKSKVEQIRSQFMDQLKKSMNMKSPKEKRVIERDVSGPISPLDKIKRENLHKKDLIPQKEQDTIRMMRSKMKAIEVLRTSKKGLGSIKKRKKIKTVPHANTHYLSESSSDEDK